MERNLIRLTHPLRRSTVSCMRMTTSADLGGWDVHTHIIPPAVIAASEKGLFGMRAEPKTLHICAHGVPLHPLSKIDALVERVKGDGLDGAIVSIPPPLVSAGSRCERPRPVTLGSSTTACWRHVDRMNLHCGHLHIFPSKTPNWPPTSLRGSIPIGPAPLRGPTSVCCLTRRNAMMRFGRH